MLVDFNHRSLVEIEIFRGTLHREPDLELLKKIGGLIVRDSGINQESLLTISYY